MNISIIGRERVGGGLAHRWTRAGHAVTEIGRDGGDASDADVVVVAVPSHAIADALGKVTRLNGKVTVERPTRTASVTRRTSHLRTK
jgi:predicted dinucleotide-binding enzyme